MLLAEARLHCSAATRTEANGNLTCGVCGLPNQLMRTSEVECIGGAIAAEDELGDLQHAPGQLHVRLHAREMHSGAASSAASPGTGRHGHWSDDDVVTGATMMWLRLLVRTAGAAAKAGARSACDTAKNPLQARLPGTTCVLFRHEPLRRPPGRYHRLPAPPADSFNWTCAISHLRSRAALVIAVDAFPLPRRRSAVRGLCSVARRGTGAAAGPRLRLRRLVVIDLSAACEQVVWQRDRMLQPARPVASLRRIVPVFCTDSRMAAVCLIAAACQNPLPQKAPFASCAAFKQDSRARQRPAGSRGGNVV